MNILASDWLIKMLEKSGRNPRERMLKLFDVLEDWLAAPEVNFEVHTDTNNQSALVNYLTLQAQQLGAETPVVLAEHIVLIAQNAAMQAKQDPNGGHLLCAKKAAEALISAQMQLTWQSVLQRPLAHYALAASVLVLFAGFWFASLFLTPSETSLEAVQTVAAEQQAPVMFQANHHKLTAQDAATMYAKFEQMRNGTCQFPEAIQIPDKHKAVYLESVVGGKLPTDLTDLAIANTYLEKVRCNYTPMLMARSK